MDKKTISSFTKIGFTWLLECFVEQFMERFFVQNFSA